VKYFLIFCLFFASASFAKEPLMEGSLNGRVQFDMIDADQGNSASDLFTEIDSKFKLNFKDYFQLNSSWLFYNVQGQGEDDRFFDDQGLVLRDLYFKIHGDDAEFLFGKVSPEFGLGWNPSKVAIGIWGDEFADDYRVVGKLGAGVKAKLDIEDYGNHVVSLYSFGNDDTDLNDSAFTRRDIDSPTEGQAGGRGSFSSYTVNIYGDDIYAMPGFFYNLSYRNLSSGITNIKDEEGYSVGLGFNYDVTSNFVLKPFIEFTDIKDFNSVNNRFNLEFNEGRNLPGDYEYLNLAFAAEYKKWGAYVNHIKRDMDSTLNSNLTSSDEQTEYSFKYSFTDNVNVSVGRKRSDVLGVDSQTTGISVGFKLGANR
jgi:hypothetical protein